MYYLNNFFFYSIFGHLFETIVYLFCEVESGILYGFWTPIYGIGCLIIIIMNKYISKKYEGITKFVLIFLSDFLILSLLEYIGGSLIELIFNYEYWNYEGFKFHIGKYVALEIAFVWGIGALNLIYLLKPISDKIIKKVPRYITWILVGLFFIDVILTIINKV